MHLSDAIVSKVLEIADLRAFILGREILLRYVPSGRDSISFSASLAIS